MCIEAYFQPANHLPVINRFVPPHHHHHRSASLFIATSPSLYANPIEAIVIGLLAVCGLGFFGIPLLLMLASVFNMNSLATSPGFMPSPLGNLGGMMPTTTTSVNGRRKRKADQLSPSMFEVLTDFIKSQDKMELLQRLIS